MSNPLFISNPNNSNTPMSTINSSDKGTKGNRRIHNIRKPFYSMQQAQAHLQTPQGSQQSPERISSDNNMENQVTNEQMQEIRETVSLFLTIYIYIYIENKRVLY